MMRPPVESVDKEIFERVWKIVEEIGAQERHFNDLQTSYRSMASAWLLATFAAIGFVISRTIHIAVDREFLVAAIAIAGCLGIGLLWILDLLVYHKLLDSCFIEGLILEDQYSWLPRLRTNMMNTQKGQGVLFRTVGFYLVPIAVLVLLAGGAVSLWFFRTGQVRLMALAAGGSIAAAVLAGIVIRSKTENTAGIRARLAEAKQYKVSAGE